ncbi:LOW QUALITY PROTEIN: peroxidasin-like [Sitophilus oryzae]|uniref:LOW QUALITY PROTEIN: peroxidasin-like n=1 Tax=Sitophilus oryzae TaxID=7048 RepID=A0A6J2YA25_SITOR|nr:LOW QUALITY PROTEIN: peroxidasin-like [Sitophilus oryzae]
MVLLRSLGLLLLLAGCLHGQKREYSGPRCPRDCYCFRRTVRCMKLELKEVPKFPQTTATLDLRFNRIRDITKGTFIDNHRLVTLLLNNNDLKRLRNETFRGLYNLQNLYLYKNRIRDIESGTFTHLTRLERLYLQANDLHEFKAATFSNLPFLDRLYLYNNHIKEIPRGAFHNLPKLQRLRLDHNALICDCKMAWFSKMLTNDKSVLQASASCSQPNEMYGKSIVGMDHRHFHCQPPKIVQSPEDVEITLGGIATFTCAVQSEEEPTIVWMKGEKEILPDDNKYKMMENGTLMIQFTEESDNGFYECLAKNPEGEVRSRPARMVVYPSQNEEGIDYDMPKLVKVPQSVSVNVGTQQVLLECQALGYPVPQIIWSHNGRQLASTSKTVILPSGTLLIRNIEGSDHGTYLCEAFNYNGRVSAEANVLINVAPIFTIQPENAEILTGGTINLECSASGTPTPEITWFKDDLEFFPNERVFYNGDRSRLELRHAIESDSGLYICEARNPLGTREVSARITISGFNTKPPKLVYKPYNIEALVGSTIELPCKAVGDPNPGITWQKDGARMQRTGRYKISLTGNLYIYKVAAEDQGRYECIANNDHGRDSASGYITVKDPTVSTGAVGSISDRFIKIAFTEASSEIDKAINNTIDNFLHNKHPSSSELFRIIRYPNAPARELARAAEVYERTLVNIRKHIQKGSVNMTHTTDFSYKEILSQEKLDLIARLSGCNAHRHTKNCSDMCFHSKYRSIDGTCNNLQHPTWGASLTGFRRVLKPIYEDGFARPVGWEKNKLYNGYPKPASRKVSTSLIATSKITQDEEITHMVMQWGQFLDHDLDHALPSVSSETWDGIDCKKSCEYAAPCYPMDVPEDDPRITNRRCIDFVRTSAICGSGMTSIFFNEVQHREQINQLTSYIDASMVNIWFSDELAREIRDIDAPLGRLKEGPVFEGRKPLLPYAGGQGMDCRRNLSESDVNCFLAGDIRVNEQNGLTAMHTLWMREHNRLAKELRYLNPHWDGDMLFYEARKIVGAAIQHITYKHWLPFVVGPKGMELLGEYKEYDPLINPSISNVFATAALRFGHTLINPILHRYDSSFNPIREGHLPLHKAFFSPWRLVEEGGIDPLLRGMFVTAAKKKMPRENLNTELTEKLFNTAHAVALDLAAMNIHRSRDHALPGYVAFRNFCGMRKVTSFDDLASEISDDEVREKMEKLYGHPENIDVFVGGILEDPVEGGRVGPLFRCLLVEQFKKLRDGDRFWYENPSVFKPEQLVQIKQYSLSRVLCDNGDNITKITKDVFVLPELQEGIGRCEDVPKVDLRLWSECCSDCR